MAHFVYRTNVNTIYFNVIDTEIPFSGERHILSEYL